jgi:hypothetical protein
MNGALDHTEFWLGLFFEESAQVHDWGRDSFPGIDHCSVIEDSAIGTPIKAKIAVKHILTPFLLVDFIMLLSSWLISRWSHTFNYLNDRTTLSNGYLGSRNDEERSEMRYVMRIAEFSESSNLWTQIALLGSPRSTPLSVSVQSPLSSVCGNLFFYGRVGWKMRVWVLALSLFKYMEWASITIRFRLLSDSSLWLSLIVTWILALVVFSTSYLFCDNQVGVCEWWLFCSCIVCKHNRLSKNLIIFIRSEFWSEMKRDNPLNLSILIRGGKETNKDSPSNGEWSGKSSIWKSIT